MADFEIAPPPLYPSLVGGAARNAQFTSAPASPDFDARLAEAKAHAAYIESLRAWSMLAARGHEGAQAVVSHPQVQEKLGARIPLLTPARVAAPAKAVTPRPLRVTTPALPQASPVADGVSGRVQLLTALVNPPPVPPGFLD